MIYITGDIHGRREILKKRFRGLKKDDVLLVAGDFGFIWDGSQKERKFLEKMAKRPVLFIDGTNENYSLLEKYPIVDFCKGKARHICGRLYQLLRGECYEFGNATLFAFGGAETDADMADADEEAARHVQPTLEQLKNGVGSVSARDGKVDYFVTHEAPATIKATVTDNRGGALNEYFDRLMKACRFSGWYFGCYHTDRSIAGIYHSLYTRVLPLEKTDGFTVELPVKNAKKKTERLTEPVL